VIPEHLRFGGGVSSAVLHPAVAVVLLLAGVLICILPQRKVIVPFLLTSLLIPYDQVLVIGGLHFPLLRILLVFGMIRIFIIKGRGEWDVFSGGPNNLDKSVILFAVTCAVAGALLFREAQAFIFQVGSLYTILGTYFFLRCLIRDRQDIDQVIRVFALIAVVLGGLMLFEHVMNGWNPYALLDGARAQYFASDLSRDGHVRATASFGTPILAGTFGAVALPLFIGLWLSDRQQRVIAALGVVGSTVMTVASHSSTSAVGYLAGLFALCLWPLRGMTRVIRWSIVLTLVSLQVVMKSPVYHLITRFSFSGDSYHRYALINETVRHFWQWWLIGTASNPSWGWGMWDTADQYVANALSGGLLGLIFFVAIIVFGFKYLGKARQATEDNKQALHLWALGSALFVYTIAFFGISLWDQSLVEWYGLLAIISAAAVPQVRPATKLAETVQLATAALPGTRPVHSGWRQTGLLNQPLQRNETRVPLPRRQPE